MKPQVMRIALVLAAEARRQLLAAGLAGPGEAELICALLPAAKAAAKADELEAQAGRLAGKAAVVALDSVAAVVAGECAKAAEEQAAYDAEFYAIAAGDARRENEPAQEGT